MTSYIGSFLYQGKSALGNPLADTLQFFGHEEGRVRVTADTTGGQSVTAFKYDYLLKDHLGNTRMVLTDEQQVDRYPAATMETGDSALENLYYTNLDAYRTALPAGYPTDTTTKPNNYVAGLMSADGSQKIGPAIVLKVMAGDMFSIQASSWYRLGAATPQNPISPLTDIVTGLISGVGAIPGGGHPLPSVLQTNSSILSGNVNTFLTTRTDTAGAGSGKPHAFINWILFDNQFNYVESSSGYDPVGADQELHPHKLINLPVTSSGYLYIYTSNETPNVEVFFDNLQVTHTRGPLLEENHYYPFGLQMSGISDRALKTQYAENKYKFNSGSELANKEFSDGAGLEMYETSFRGYDPQLGRFWQIDPSADQTKDLSPYSFANNNPISYNDPFGLDTAWKVLPEVVVTPPPPAPRSTVDVGLADTQGGNPEVSAGPAPSTPGGQAGGNSSASTAPAGANTNSAIAIPLVGGITGGFSVSGAITASTVAFVGLSAWGLLDAHSGYSPPYNPVGDIAIAIPAPHIPQNLARRLSAGIPLNAPAYPGNDPAAQPSGYEWRGKPGSRPGSKEGNWYNPGTKEWLRPDLEHKEPIGPHWDWGAPDGKEYRIYPDGRVEPK